MGASLPRRAPLLEDTSGAPTRDFIVGSAAESRAMDRIETGWLRDAMVAFRDETVLYLRTCAGFAFRPPALPCRVERRDAPRAEPPRFHGDDARHHHRASTRARFPSRGDASRRGRLSLLEGRPASRRAVHPLPLARAREPRGAPALRRSRTSARVARGHPVFGRDFPPRHRCPLSLRGVGLPGAASRRRRLPRRRECICGGFNHLRGLFRNLFALLVASLARTHGVSAWLSTVAVAAAVVASALVFGALRPPGSYGLHPVVWIDRDAAGHWRGRFELSSS